MRRILPLVSLVFLLGACASNSSGNNKPTAVANVHATAAATKAATPNSTPGAHVTRTAAPLQPEVASSKPYTTFLASICHALTTRDASTLTAALPYYQYNSGLRYGLLGDGEGLTGDPSLFGSWLASAHVVCVRFTPDIAGHGTVLTSGWGQFGGWSLIEMDTFNGVWKLNDLTFGQEGPLNKAMATSSPIMPYRG